MKKLFSFRQGVLLLAELVSVSVLGLLCSFLLSFLTFHFYASKMYRQVNQVPKTRVALVLGAGIHPDGTLSDILEDRVQAAAALYKAGKVQKLLMSGDNRYSNYSEPDAMKQRAIALGVPENDIQADYAGRRTYDSCWRAKNIFSLDHLLIVTQSFHMARSVFLCQRLGIESIGFIADQPRYTLQQWMIWIVRDMLSLDQAYLNIYLTQPKVIKGEKITI